VKATLRDSKSLKVAFTASGCTRRRRAALHHATFGFAHIRGDDVKGISAPAPVLVLAAATLVLRVVSL
jgi:hypothetical protein